MDAWLLSSSNRFLDKAHDIILRVIHPDDDVSTLGLLNAELRWSYTVFFQSLLKYLTVTAGVVGSLDSFVKASLNTYGEWMLKNERLYFDRVEELEFPTETWHAQDLRKANVLIGMAQYHPSPELSAQMKSRGTQMRDEAWRSLLESETRGYSRACALALQQLPIQLFVDLPSERSLVGDSIAVKTTWPQKKVFIDQKSFVKMGMKRPVALLSMVIRSLWIPYWLPTMNEISPVRRIKTKLGLRK